MNTITFTINFHNTSPSIECSSTIEKKTDTTGEIKIMKKDIESSVELNIKEKELEERKTKIKEKEKELEIRESNIKEKEKEYKKLLLVPYNPYQSSYSTYHLFSDINKGVNLIENLD
jgi:hypothetical protein